MPLLSRWGLTAIVLAILLAELVLAGDALEYRRSLLPAEPWRLLTGHFVHLSLAHALLNCVALVLIGRLFSDRLSPGDLAVLLFAAPVAISLAFWAAMPELEWYRGLSGALHAIFFAGCMAWVAQARGRARWLPAIALVAAALKVLLEQPWDGSFPIHRWLGAPVVPQAHLVGAALGVAAGLLLVHCRSRHTPADGEPPG